MLQYQFIQNAILASLMASLVCGVIGVVVVEKKLVMMSGGIAHTSYGGVGLGYLLGIEPILGALLFSIGAAFGIGWMKRKGGTRADIIIGLFWSLGMASGILFVGLMPGYPPDLGSYLFGSILSVTRSELRVMGLFTIVILLSILLLFEHWKAFLFDAEFSTLLGMKTKQMEYLMLVLIAVSVVVLIRVVGIILVLALFTAPNAIAALMTRSLKGRMAISVLIGAGLCITGLWLSVMLAIPSGAAIVLLASASFFSAIGISALARHRRTQARKRLQAQHPTWIP